MVPARVAVRRRRWWWTRRGRAVPNPDGTGVFRSEDGGKTWKLHEQAATIGPCTSARFAWIPRTIRRFSPAAIPAAFHTMAARRGPASRFAHRLSRHLDQSQGSAQGVGRPRWRLRSQQRWRRDVGITTTISRSGQFYQVSADMRRPYYVCGGLQDNNAWCGPSALRSNTGPANDGLVHRGGRRRLLHPAGSHRLGHRLRRIAGWRHEPSRSPQRNAEEHPAQSGRRARRGGGNHPVG